MKAVHHLLAAGVAMSGVLAAPSVWAAGTPAGTLILNTASVSFSTPSGTTTLQTNTVTIKVDQLIGVAVTSLTSAPVTIGASSAVLTFQVTNIGNGADTFDLTGAPNVSGNAFTAALQAVAIDSNGNGTYDSGVDAVIANGAASPTIAPDATIRVFLVVTAPTSATDAASSSVRLSATSLTGSGAPGTLFAGKGIGGVDAVVGLSDGTASALAGLITSLASVSLTKSAAIVDPYGGGNPVSGAIVTYAIVAHTTGSATADNLVVTDAYPTGTTYQSGTLALNGAVLSDAADSDAGTATASGISVQLGNVAGGSGDKTITFKVKIN